MKQTLKIRNQKRKLNPYHLLWLVLIVLLILFIVFHFLYKNPVF